MKRKNIAAMITSIALVGAVAVGGTLALLTSQTEDLTNTFTVGAGYANTKFALQEDVVAQTPNDVYDEDNVKIATAGDYIAKTGEDGQVTVTENDQSYANVIPGSSLHKNPFFSLALKEDASEGASVPESWIVARVSVEDLTDLNNKGVTFSEVLSGDMWYQVKKTDNTWEIVMDKEKPETPAVVTADTYNNHVNSVDGYLYFVYSVSLSNGAKTASLFDTLAVDADTTKVNAEDWTNNGISLEIEGVAVQKLEGATLEGSLQTIMADATGALNA